MVGTADASSRAGSASNDEPYLCHSKRLSLCDGTQFNGTWRKWIPALDKGVDSFALCRPSFCEFYAVLICRSTSHLYLQDLQAARLPTDTECDTLHKISR